MRLPYAGIARIRFNGYNLRLRAEPPLGEDRLERREIRVKQKTESCIANPNKPEKERIIDLLQNMSFIQLRDFSY